jgi:hypothetical protein
VSAAAPAPDPLAAKIAQLDVEISGRREASRLLGEAQRVARWRHWAGKEASFVAITAISSARARLSREVKKLREERECLRVAGSVS